MKSILAVCFSIIPLAAGNAQVAFTSPLPLGILQVRGDHADLRLHITISGYSSFSVKLGSDIDTTSPEEGWFPISVRNGIVDTILTVPKSHRDYSIYWRTGITASDTQGIIPGLTPGHIIGVAGQSNAVGWVWPPPGEFVAVAKGDIRMLTNDSAWQPATEPTGGIAQGPWIEMANILYASIGDTLPIGIVNTAVGGTGLTATVGSGRWLKNSPDPGDTMYPDAIDRFRHAGSELEELTWIQGEADGQSHALIDPNVYRVQFASLMQDFMADLADTFAVFHLQISGFSGHSTNAGSYPEVREAQRLLPPSTLVGTAIGRPLWDSAFHYTVATYQAVGRMFAAAVLKELYGIDTAMYPPLMPDTIAQLDSITDGSIRGRYCFSLGWTRNGKPADLVTVRPDQYFGIQEDGIPLDTSLVWFRISPSEASRLQIGLRNDSITLNHDWRITYDAAAGGERAPLATMDPSSGDTIFATGFYELPVDIPSLTAGVKEFSVQYMVPNPTANAMNCEVLAFKHETMSIELLDNLGSILRSQNVVLEEGLHEIPVSTEGLASGNYWVVLRDEKGNETLEKAVIVH